MSTDTSTLRHRGGLLMISTRRCSSGPLLSTSAIKLAARSFTRLLPGAPGGIRTPNLLIRRDENGVFPGFRSMRAVRICAGQRPDWCRPGPQRSGLWRSLCDQSVTNIKIVWVSGSKVPRAGRHSSFVGDGVASLPSGHSWTDKLGAGALCPTAEPAHRRRPASELTRTPTRQKRAMRRHLLRRTGARVSSPPAAVPSG